MNDRACGRTCRNHSRSLRRDLTTGLRDCNVLWAEFEVLQRLYDEAERKRTVGSHGWRQDLDAFLSRSVQLCTSDLLLNAVPQPLQQLGVRLSLTCPRNPAHLSTMAAECHVTGPALLHTVAAHVHRLRASAFRYLGDHAMPRGMPPQVDESCRRSAGCFVRQYRRDQRIDADAAVAAYRAVLSLQPEMRCDSKGPYEMYLAESLGLRGLAASTSGDYQAAVFDLSEACAIGRDYGLAREAIGWTTALLVAMARLRHGNPRPHYTHEERVQVGMPGMHLEEGEIPC